MLHIIYIDTIIHHNFIVNICVHTLCIQNTPMRDNFRAHLSAIKQYLLSVI